MNDYDKKYFERFAMDASTDLDWDDHYEADVDFDSEDELEPFDNDMLPDSDDEILDDGPDYEE